MNMQMIQSFPSDVNKAHRASFFLVNKKGSVVRLMFLERRKRICCDRPLNVQLQHVFVNSRDGNV